MNPHTVPTVTAPRHLARRPLTAHRELCDFVFFPKQRARHPALLGQTKVWQPYAIPSWLMNGSPKTFFNTVSACAIDTKHNQLHVCLHLVYCFLSVYKTHFKQYVWLVLAGRYDRPHASALTRTTRNTRHPCPHGSTDPGLHQPIWARVHRSQRLTLCT